MELFKQILRRAWRGRLAQALSRLLIIVLFAVRRSPNCLSMHRAPERGREREREISLRNNFTCTAWIAQRLQQQPRIEEAEPDFGAQWTAEECLRCQLPDLIPHLALFSQSQRSRWIALFGSELKTVLRARIWARIQRGVRVRQVRQSWLDQVLAPTTCCLQFFP